MAYQPNNPNGQATMANSSPVVVASDQSALSTQGNVASAATDSGNPVKVGGVYRASVPTFTDGQRGDAQIDANGNLKITFTDPTIINSTTHTLNVSLATSLSSNVDNITSYDATDAIMNNTVSVTPLFATIATSTSGASTLISAASGKKIRVLSLSITANAAVNIKFQSHVTPTDLTGLFYMATNGLFTLQYNPKGWFQTVVGESLDINLSGAIAVGGCITYITV